MQTILDKRINISVHLSGKESLNWIQKFMHPQKQCCHGNSVAIDPCMGMLP